MRQYDDAWLSRIMKKPVFRVTMEDGNLEFPPDNFWYSKVSVSNVDAAKILTSNSFYIVDTNVTFVSNSSNKIEALTDVTVRKSRMEDEKAVREIARTTFRYTRFHADPNIDDNVADQIKEEWVGNYFRGDRGDLMLVAEKEGRLVGFCQVLIREEAIIDLIGVAQHAQGCGVGKAMIAELQKMHHKILVGTQLANKKSIALYERMGFCFNEAQYVFHCHGIDK